MIYLFSVYIFIPIKVRRRLCQIFPEYRYSRMGIQYQSPEKPFRRRVYESVGLTAVESVQRLCTVVYESSDLKAFFPYLKSTYFCLNLCPMKNMSQTVYLTLR
jgi:hypothetical protein